MPDVPPAMPDPVENYAFIPTLDSQGAIWLYIDEITQAYLDFAAQTQGTMLEVAAGYGHVVLKTLESGAAKVYANEVDRDQLAIIETRVSERFPNKIIPCLGRFPEDLEFPDCSFDGIFNARLFHFFDGDRIRAGLAKIYRWLKPGGQVYLVNDAVYRTIFQPLISVYEGQIAAGAEWPGLIADIRACLPEYLRPDTFPKMMNFMDPTVLTRELAYAGFEAVTSKFCAYTGSFALGRLDGRELAGAIGRRP
jgi:SAM-dependent methyltransferase